MEKPKDNHKLKFWVNIFLIDGVKVVGPFIYQTKEQADKIYPMHSKDRIGCKEVEIEV